MDGGDAGGVQASRLAWAFPVGFLLLTLLTRFSNAVYWSGIAGGVVLAGLFVLPLLRAVRWGRTLWARRGGWLLAVQAVATYVPLAFFGQDWINIAPGLLAGLILLTVSAPASWVMFGAVLGVEVARIAILGLPPAANAAIVTWMLVAPVTTGLAFFGLVRLGDLATSLHAARTELADLAVLRERRWSAERLRAAVGDHLVVVAARARTALAALPDRPDEARALLVEAAGIARRALGQVRTVAETSDQQGAGLPPVESSGTAVAPRLARLTLAVVLGSYAAILMANVLVTGGPVALMAGAAATIAAVAALQLRHSLGWRGESRPRGWRWTLTAQILLPFGWLPVYDWNILGLAGTAAGSALLLLPRRWGWTVFAAVMAGVAAAWSLPALDVYHGLSDRYGLTLDLVAVLYQLGAAATSGIVVYGLSRLTTVTGDLEATRRELARAAVERERLRVAQDTHDLLGLGLSAVALKSDLAGRLVGRDDTRARGELDALVRLAAQARADVLAVTADERHRSLLAELPAAREVLASAGITAEVRAQPLVGSLPEEVAAVLAAALREAVTNVLRHAVASHCEIELTAAGHELVLRVANDGVANDVTGEPPDRQAGRRGHGLANMAARAAAVGGRLSSSAGGGRFEVTVRVPLPAGSSVRGAEDALAAGNTVHAVDEVAAVLSVARNPDRPAAGTRSRPRGRPARR